MKRLTALILAGVLLLGTACGGENQTNSGGTKADAGATAAQKPEEADSAVKPDDADSAVKADEAGGAAESEETSGPQQE